MNKQHEKTLTVSGFRLASRGGHYRTNNMKVLGLVAEWVIGTGHIGDVIQLRDDRWMGSVCFGDKHPELTKSDSIYPIEFATAEEAGAAVYAAWKRQMRGAGLTVKEAVPKP